MSDIKRRGWWVAVAFSWFGLISALQPMSVAPAAYVLAWALLLLLSRTVSQLPLWQVGGSASAIYIAGAALGVWPIDFAILLPVGAIFISLLIAGALGAYQSALGQSAGFHISEARSEPKSIASVYANLHVELQRARSHGRPLSVLAISAADDAEDKVARLASLLSDEMRSFDVLGVSGDHFVSMLPETDSEKAIQFAKRLRDVAQEELGLELAIGLSSFPMQATLDALVEHAESDMTSSDVIKLDPQISDAPTSLTDVRSESRESSWSA